jgi:hypothetical protein
MTTGQFNALVSMLAAVLIILLAIFGLLFAHVYWHWDDHK